MEISIQPKNEPNSRIELQKKQAPHKKNIHDDITPHFLKNIKKKPKNTYVQ